MTNDTSLESVYGLLLESTKKIANLQKLIFLQKSRHSGSVPADLELGS